MATQFSRATIYALMTNCLQFSKEAHVYPGNSGTSQTRALLSELLAIKLLREYTTRELIDALSYEFDPLQSQSHGQDQGQNQAAGTTGPGTTGPMGRVRGGAAAAAAARISCLEVAIRAQAKRFLAHPVVVQQLEAIWAGSIVFHSAADSLHRTAARNGSGQVYSNRGERTQLPSRRSVTLYDPRDASLFKLSRLRVPRYRQFLSTVSFAVLLGLFLAVQQQRRADITTLEIVFWLWSAGFMLDEIVGFNEQGFSLYLMSFWNVFDLGILLLLFCYYCMRFYGAFLSSHNDVVSDLAYDILAANAVLLFPRLFSVLDHYRYFSQLLIAFRIMAADLVAVVVLIIIVCSGFLVAFTFSFGHHDSQSPGSIAYALFQMLMGFSPAAWTLWEEYNVLGKAILTVFLFICHFVVITILITVLTNSFMRIVQNADQEHQFLFAVNAISMVKSDALFSYVAPTNLLAWVITPLRSVMPFKQFVRLNRTIIKLTHLPILFSICLYERVVLARASSSSSTAMEPETLAPPGMALAATPPALVMPAARPRNNRRFRTFSKPALVREPSIATHQKDRALDEVFQHLFQHEDERESQQMRLQPHRPEKTSRMVKTWMRGMGPGPIHPPAEEDPNKLDRLERPKLRVPLRRFSSLHHQEGVTETSRSVASNPEYNKRRAVGPSRHSDGEVGEVGGGGGGGHGDGDGGDAGDDEMTSDSSHGSHHSSGRKGSSRKNKQSSKKSRTGTISRTGSDASRKTVEETRAKPRTATRSRRNSPRRPKHYRTMSGATIRTAAALPAGPGVGPGAGLSLSLSGPQPGPRQSIDAALQSNAGPETGSSAPGSRSRSRTRSRSRSLPRPLPRGRELDRTRNRRQSYLLDLGSDLGDNKARANGFLGMGMGIGAGSFTTEMAYATGRRRSSMDGRGRGLGHGLWERERDQDRDRDQDQLSRLVLARMNNIEEGFREVIREVKDLRSSQSHSQSQSQS